MDRVIKVVLTAVCAMAFLTGCPGNNQPVAAAPGAYPAYAYGQCQPGQACPTAFPTCAPGQVGCSFAPGGYVHFIGDLGQLNKGAAHNLIRDYYGVYSWCWLGNCYGQSTIDIIITPGSSGAFANVTINIGGYPIGGQAQARPINNNSGTDLLMVPFGAGGSVDVISNNFPLDGSVSSIPAVQIMYNGQQLALTSLIRSGY